MGLLSKLFHSDNLRKVDFEYFVKDMSDMIDCYIISERKKNGILFVGGLCEIYRDSEDPDEVIVKTTLYNKKDNDKWEENTLEYKRKVSMFTDDEETKTSLEGLLNEPLKMKIQIPDMEG